jgi:hypothetical protein
MLFLILMAARVSDGDIVSLMLRIVGVTVSGCGAILLFAVSVMSYAFAFGAWAHGSLDGLSLIIGPALTLAAIGTVAIQTSAGRMSKKLRIICGVLGGMGSLSLAYFSLYSVNFFKTGILHIEHSAVAAGLFFAAATIVTTLRTNFVLRFRDE